jgi:ABC-2 type transport system ATP-binding protein
MPVATARSIKTSQPTALKSISLADVGVRYLLLTEDQRTFKGRVLNLLRPPVPAAQFWALQNISLSINPGEVVGVVGRNGSGKSTLMRVMSGVIQPTAGSVEVKGLISPLLELGGPLNGELTGRENAYLYGALFKFSRAQMDEMIPQIIAFSELGTFFDIPIKTYSSGMTARLAFSVATQMQPEILLLDEILSVGDEQFQKKSFLRIKKLIDRGTIVVMVSHSSETIERLCTRVVYLLNGQLVADGKPHTVVEKYRKEAASSF